MGARGKKKETSGLSYLIAERSKTIISIQRDQKPQYEGIKNAHNIDRQFYHNYVVEADSANCAFRLPG